MSALLCETQVFSFFCCLVQGALPFSTLGRVLSTILLPSQLILLPSQLKKHKPAPQRPLKGMEKTNVKSVLDKYIGIYVRFSAEELWLLIEYYLSVKESVYIFTLHAKLSSSYSFRKFTWKRASK